MTEKQETLIRKITDLSDEYVNKLKEIRGQSLYDFIKFICDYDKKFLHNMLFKTEDYHNKEIEDEVNKDVSKYSSISDEWISIKKKVTIPGTDYLYYIGCQTWYKGMSNTSTSKYCKIDLGNGISIYEALIELKIFSLPDLTVYVRNHDYIGGK